MNREEVEIRTQTHLMDAEGAHNYKPDSEDIKTLIEREGFRCRNLEIWFDDFQNLWRWNCDISRI